MESKFISKKFILFLFLFVLILIAMNFDEESQAGQCPDSINGYVTWQSLNYGGLDQYKYWSVFPKIYPYFNFSANNAPNSMSKVSFDLTVDNTNPCLITVDVKAIIPEFVPSFPYQSFNTQVLVVLHPNFAAGEK